MKVGSIVSCWLLLLCVALTSGCSSNPAQHRPTAALVKEGCPTARELGHNVKCSKNVKDLKALEKDVVAYATSQPNHEILVVFDIDDTLLTSTQFFGGDTWYRWQSRDPMQAADGRIITIEEKDRLKCIFAKFNALYEFARYQPTQTNAHELVSRLQQTHSVLALTSRAPGARVGTERELRRAKIHLETSHLMATEHSLRYEIGSRGVSYANGIVMSSGLDKGVVLDAVLTKVGRVYDAIFIIDDGAPNLARVNNFWKGKATAIRLYHYTRVDKTVTNRELAEAVKTNSEFNDFLNAAYPDRWRDFSNEQCD